MILKRLVIFIYLVFNILTQPGQSILDNGETNSVITPKSNDESIETIVSAVTSSTLVEEKNVIEAVVDVVLNEVKSDFKISTNSIESESNQDQDSATSSSTIPITTTSKASAVVVDVVVNKNKPEMQSFEEWKEMKLKDKLTSSNLQKSSDLEHATASSSLAKPNNAAVELNGQRKNYASLDCGAKIIGSNSESNNPSHVLTESKDDYMLNSCSRRSWFVVELCEPIKLSQIELANFELFSNVPRLFRVYASERFVPQSGWSNKYALGVFEAANTRSIQTFSLSDIKKDTINSVTQQQQQQTNSAESSSTDNVETTSSSSSTSTSLPVTSSTTTNNQNNNNNNNNHNTVIMYAKYVKFEMLSHYGTEHYCPLSLVRIYGTSMAEDEEEAISSHELHQPTPTPITPEQLEVPVKSIESSTEPPKETSQETSKKEENQLIKPIEKDQPLPFPPPPQPPSTLKLTVSLFLNNLISSLLGENFNLKSLFQPFESGSVAQNTFTINNSNPKPKKPSDFTTNIKSSSTNNKIKPVISIVNLVPHGSKQQKKRANLIQIDFHKLICFNSNQMACCECSNDTISNSSSVSNNNDNHNKTFNWLSEKCAYYFLISTLINNNKSLIINYMNRFYNSNPNENESVLIKNSSENTEILINGAIQLFILDEWLDNQTKKFNLANTMKKHNIQNVQLSHEANGPTSSPKENNSKTKYTEYTEKEETVPVEIKKINQQKQEDEKLDGILTSTFSTSQDMNINNEKEKELINKEENLKPQTNIQKNENDLNQVYNNNNNAGLLDPAEPTTTSTTTPMPEVTTASSIVSASAETVLIDESGDPAKNTPTSAAKQQQSQPIIIANGKEAVFMRLSNRIKVLELNMSLSSQYLEKLSQHYRYLQ